ncbi:MAG: HDOD domain-containing protein, partial [Clostridia bacterium]|nr:HDOD domain-containing protein [Clostridia bacterium]
MDIYLGRQAIYDTRMNVFAYELLYRASEKNVSGVVDGDSATSAVITNSITLFGLNKLTEGKRAFINFTRKLIMEEMPHVLDKSAVVVEILEDIIPDQEFLEACRMLKEKGYILALDDYCLQNENMELLNIIDIIKVDFRLTTKEERVEIVQRYKKNKIIFLAEKVESEQEYQDAIDAGYKLFQGFFFSKPSIMTAKDFRGQTYHYLRILEELEAEEPNFSVITKIFESDVALSYRLLKLLNSAAFQTRSEITSINHALVILGLREIYKWVMLMMMRDMGENRPDELIRLSLVRGKFSELIMAETNHRERKTEAFMVGLFSMLDLLVGEELSTVLKEIPISEEVKAALLGESNIFSKVLDLTVCYEFADW